MVVAIKSSTSLSKKTCHKYDCFESGATWSPPLFLSIVPLLRLQMRNADRPLLLVVTNNNNNNINSNAGGQDDHLLLELIPIVSLLLKGYNERNK